MHTTTRHSCVGEVGSPADVVGRTFTFDVLALGRSVEAAAGGVVAAGGAGASALPTCVPVAGSGAVCSLALGAAVGRAVAAVFGCPPVVAVGGRATVVLRCRPVAGGRVLGCRGATVSGCSDTESVAESVARVPGMAAVTGSGGEAAWLVEDLVVGSAATVRPPPTRATAVAATARRRFFFQRASWRRRAARPVPAASVVALSDAELPTGAASE